MSTIPQSENQSQAVLTQIRAQSAIRGIRTRKIRTQFKRAETALKTQIVNLYDQLPTQEQAELSGYFGSLLESLELLDLEVNKRTDVDGRHAFSLHRGGAQ